MAFTVHMACFRPLIYFIFIYLIFGLNTYTCSTNTGTMTTNAICVYDFTCFSIDDKENIFTWLRTHTKKWCFQLESCPTTGHHHFQGRFSLKTKRRLHNVVELLTNDQLQFHLTPTSIENHTNMFYVMKNETRIDGPWADSDLAIPRHLRDTPTWYPWQQSIIDSINVYDDRVVDVVIDTTGNIGKSYMCSWLGVRGLARRVPIQRESRDIARMVMNCPKTKCYFIDLPRATATNNIHTMYTAVEEIKNGYAYDDRYHFREEYFEPPRVWIFTNEVPPGHLLSRDRWRLWRVGADRTLKTLASIDEAPPVEAQARLPLTLNIIR